MKVPDDIPYTLDEYGRKVYRVSTAFINRVSPSPESPFSIARQRKQFADREAKRASLRIKAERDMYEPLAREVNALCCDTWMLTTDLMANADDDDILKAAVRWPELIQTRIESAPRDKHRETWRKVYVRKPTR